MEHASTLQEAVDTIVRVFDHPENVSVEYTFADGEKRTLFEVTTSEGEVAYELSYDGRRDGEEPSLTRVTDSDTVSAGDG